MEKGTGNLGGKNTGGDQTSMNREGETGSEKMTGPVAESDCGGKLNRKKVTFPKSGRGLLVGTLHCSRGKGEGGGRGWEAM